MIPKIIWQTHESEWNDLSVSFKKTAMSWINLNPDWEYKYYSKNDRIKLFQELDQTVYERTQLEPGTYENVFLNSSVQSDIFKHLVLYKFGGVYCDMESFCIKPLDYMFRNLSSDIEVVALAHSDGVISNSNIASIKESSIMRDVFENMKNEPFEDVQFTGKGMGAIEYFIEATKDNPKVSLDFQAIYSEVFREPNFKQDFDIDYYGENIKYIEFISRTRRLEF